jgi:hypothetical protein
LGEWQVQENPDTGCAAIAAANRQESIFGNLVGKYISALLHLAACFHVITTYQFTQGSALRKFNDN